MKHLVLLFSNAIEVCLRKQEKKTQKETKSIQWLSNFVLFVYKDTDVLVCRELSAFRDLSSFLVSDTDYPPTTPFSEESQAERKPMESQAWSGDRTEQPKSGLQSRGSSLVTDWSTGSHAFTVKLVWPTVLQLTGGKSPQLSPVNCPP